MKRYLLAALLLLPLSAFAQPLQIYCNHQSAVACTTASPGTPVGAWDPPWLIGGKSNANFNALDSNFSLFTTPNAVTFPGSATTTGQLAGASSVIGSPTGGNCGAGCLNAQSGIQIGGVPVPSYPRTSAEISASVIPTTLIYPQGNVFRYMTSAQITDVTSGTASLDVSGAIQNALNVGGAITVPCNIYRLASGVTIPNGTYISGQGCAGGATGNGGNSPNATWGATWQCDLSVATCVTLVGVDNGWQGSAGISYLNITRAAGTIPASSIGLKVGPVVGSVISHVNVARASIGVYAGSPTTTSINLHADHLYISAVTDAYLVQDTFAELYITDCRFGGANDQAANTYIRITGGSTSNAAAGPNGLFVSQCQFNSNANTTNWLQFKNVTPSAISDIGEWSFVNCHIEALSGTYIVSDSTWPSINRLKLTNVHFNSIQEFLSLGASTQVNEWQISNSFFASTFTFSPAVTNYLTLNGNIFTGLVNVTSPGSNQGPFISTGNQYKNGLTLSGAWSEIQVLNDAIHSGSFTDTSTATHKLVSTNDDVSTSGSLAINTAEVDHAIRATCSNAAATYCIQQFAPAGNDARMLIAGNGNTSSTGFYIGQTGGGVAILNQQNNNQMNINTNNLNRVIIGGNGAVVINAPSSGVGLTVSGGGANITGNVAVAGSGNSFAIPTTTVANIGTTCSTTGVFFAVTDATTPTLGSTVAGSGAAKALVWCNGANYTVIGK